MIREHKTPIWTDSQIMASLDYQIYHYLNKDFKTINLHSHDFYEIYLFVKGKATYIIENNRYTLLPGDIMLVPPNSLHQLYIQDSALTYDRYVLWLHPSYVASLSTDKTPLSTCFDACKSKGTYLIRNEQITQQITAMIETLLSIEEHENFGNDMMGKITIANILLTLARHTLSSMDNVDKTYKVNMQNTRIREVLSYIDENIRGDLSLEAIARHMFLSKYYLARLFRDETGTPLHQYIVKRRLVYAKELIASGMPIVEVYLKVGFSDYSHFFRAFKNEYGVTPKEYCNYL